MSRLYASIRGQAKTEATRRGGKASGISGHIRTWDYGVKVVGCINEDDKEEFAVFITGGSKDPKNVSFLFTVIDGEVQFI